MPRVGQFKTVEYLMPSSSDTCLSESKRPSVSRALIMDKTKSQIGTFVNPKSGRGGKSPATPPYLHPKMGGRKMSAMTAVRQTAAQKPARGRAGKIYGERLKTARQALGYETAKDFADFLRIHPGTYRNYERGAREMSYEDLEKLAGAGVSIEWLILGRAPALSPALIRSG